MANDTASNPTQLPEEAQAERRWMQLAVEAAANCKGEDKRKHPSVGAVAVLDGKLLGSAHRGEVDPGEHAEFTLLRKLETINLEGATVYATLEPCTRRSKKKRACAYRLADRKIAKVVFAMLDPNPDIQGHGERYLQSCGIDVARFDFDLLQRVIELNKDFIEDQERRALKRKKNSTRLRWALFVLVIACAVLVYLYAQRTDATPRARLILESSLEVPWPVDGPRDVNLRIRISNYGESTANYVLGDAKMILDPRSLEEGALRDIQDSMCSTLNISDAGDSLFGESLEPSEAKSHDFVYKFRQETTPHTIGFVGCIKYFDKDGKEPHTKRFAYEVIPRDGALESFYVDMSKPLEFKKYATHPFGSGLESQD